jgi:hypothetical protein
MTANRPTNRIVIHRGGSIFALLPRSLILGSWPSGVGCSRKPAFRSYLNEACGGVLLEVCRIVLALHVVAYCAHSSRTVLSSPYFALWTAWVPFLIPLLRSSGKV